MDSDLQHPPEAIPTLLAARAGNDVVYAVRSPSDAAGFWKRFSARIFYGLLNRLSSLELPEGAADYRLDVATGRRRAAVDARAAPLPARARPLGGLRQTFVEYSRPVARSASRSTARARWSSSRGTRSSASPRSRCASRASLGALVSLLGWIYLLYVLVVRIFTDRAVPGLDVVTAAVLLLGGAQLVFLGILGQYVGRMYDDVKRRPLFLDRRGHERLKGKRAGRPAHLGGNA